MKVPLILIFLILVFTIKIKAQPTGERKMAKVFLSVVDEKKDTINFKKNNSNTYTSINKLGYSISFLSQNNILDISGLEEYNKIFLENHKKDSTIQYKWEDKFIKDSLVPFDELILENNKKFIFIYFPSTERLGSNKIEPSKDIIILVKRKKKKMKISLKLYTIKSEFEMGSNISIYVPFREGTFEITDSINPKLESIIEK
ncbi:MAG TPA: hypothetical protein VF677_11420 [Flavobacterium sp.]|jgi:hypothetical protein